MRAFGYTFDTALEANHAFPSTPDETARPSVQELNQAISDAGCRTKSQLDRVLFDEESHIQSDEIVSNSSLIEDFQHKISQAVARAKVIAVSG